ncbi:MAG: hypothetical protein RIM84_12330 [Alphaproteobacteria bacterium]
MGRTQLDLARNLIETLGAQRAVHVAKQYCWYGVADEIARLSAQAANDDTARVDPATAH